MIVRQPSGRRMPGAFLQQVGQGVPATIRELVSVIDGKHLARSPADRVSPSHNRIFYLPILVSRSMTREGSGSRPTAPESRKPVEASTAFGGP